MPGHVRATLRTHAMARLALPCFAAAMAASLILSTLSGG